MVRPQPGGNHSNQEIFLTQGSNLSLFHCRQILHCLSHQGSITAVSEHRSKGKIWVKTMEPQLPALTIYKLFRKHQFLLSPVTYKDCCCLVASVVSDSVQPHRWQPTRLPRPWDSPGKNTGVGCHFPLQCMKVKSESEVATTHLNFHLCTHK